MTAPARPVLTDRDALARHRARAFARHDPALFLHEDAAAEVEERRSMIKRTFTAPAVVTGAPGFWRDAMPEARVVPDTEVLDLAEGAHDLVVHALALHWADDPVGQLVQARRALAPDGLLIALTLGGQTLTELRQSLATAEAQLRAGLSPRVVPMGEIRDLGALLQRAGFALPVADGFTRQVSYATPLHLMRDLRAMGETNALADRDRRFTPRAVLTEAMRLYAETFAGADGRVPATFDVICLTGWAPAADQPQPLRPGSATTRLADALGAEERPLPDKAGS